MVRACLGLVIAGRLSNADHRLIIISSPSVWDFSNDWHITIRHPRSRFGGGDTLDHIRGPANLLWPPLVGFGTIVLGFVAGYYAGRALGLQVGTELRTFAFTVGVYNYGFIPIPVMESLFNREHVGVLLVHNVGCELAPSPGRGHPDAVRAVATGRLAPGVESRHLLGRPQHDSFQPAIGYPINSHPVCDPWSTDSPGNQTRR